MKRASRITPNPPIAGPLRQRGSLAPASAIVGTVVDAPRRESRRPGNSFEDGSAQVLVAVLALVSLGMTLLEAFNPQPIALLGLCFDRSTVILSLLVAVVGNAVIRFSIRYMQGDPDRKRFVRWLVFTVVAAYLLMLAGHMALLFVAWSLTSLGLHNLLLHYRNRPMARVVVRSKFLVSRMGDAALLTAIGLIGLNTRTLDLHGALTLAATHASSTWVFASTLLIAVAALTKSAQFPFHSWLPETLEAPTPVSALMHAGIVNGGGALLLKFSPLLVRVPMALLVLSIFGSITMVVGMLAMWAQGSVKRRFAWSTVAQMGFMVAECGIACFSAALLHIVAHGVFKAYSFLRTPTLSRVEVAKPEPQSGRYWMICAGFLLTGVSLLISSKILLRPLELTSGGLSMTFLFCLSIGLVWATVSAQKRIPLRFAALMTLTPFIAGGFTILYGSLNAYFQPVFGANVTSDSPMLTVAALLPAASLIMLTVIFEGMKRFQSVGWTRALLHHASNGFYAGDVAHRMVNRLWAPISAPMNGAMILTGKGAGKGAGNRYA